MSLFAEAIAVVMYMTMLGPSGARQEAWAQPIADWNRIRRSASCAAVPEVGVGDTLRYQDVKAFLVCVEAFDRRQATPGRAQ